MRRLNRPILIAVVVIIILLFIGFALPLAAGRNLGTSTFGDNIPIDVVELNEFAVLISIEDTESMEDSDKVLVTVEGLVFPGRSSEVGQVCLEELVLIRTNPGDIQLANLPKVDLSELVVDGEYWGSSHRRGFDPTISFDELENSVLCTDYYGTGRLLNLQAWNQHPENTKLAVELDVEKSPVFFFPLDRRVLSFRAYLAPIEGPYIQPKVAGLITSSDWDEKVSISPSRYVIGEFGIDRPVQIEITYLRPVGTIILTLSILGLLAFFITYLLFIKENSSFVEVSVGILLGLWGVQGILVPSNINGPLMIRALLLALYVWFGLVVILRFTIMPLWSKLEPEITEGN